MLLREAVQHQRRAAQFSPASELTFFVQCSQELLEDH
jgi:hypothetical protein